MDTCVLGEARRCKHSKAPNLFSHQFIHLPGHYWVLTVHHSLLFFSFISNKLLSHITFIFFPLYLPQTTMVTLSKTATEKGRLFAVDLNKNKSDLTVN